MQQVSSFKSGNPQQDVSSSDFKARVNKSTTIKNVCCIGGGYVGGPSSTVMAHKASHINVTVVDCDAERIRAWKSSKLPVDEPGLLDLITVARDGTPGREPNLAFSTAIDEAIRRADCIIVAVNTPTKESGVGAGEATDLSLLESAIRRIGRSAEHDTIVVQKSTVPCGTAEKMQEILRADAKPGVNLEVLSNPEFLAEGTATSDLLWPDRLIIGHYETKMGRAAAEALAGVYATWVPPDRIIKMSTFSAELSKLASNALLAQRISSINALSAICESTGADIREVSYACGLDIRIGSSMLNASVGFGGSCFKKDLMSLSHAATVLDLPEVSAYWNSVVEINKYQKRRFIQKIVETMHSNISGKKMAVLGFAFKKDTGDTRESSAISVVKSLLAENAVVAIFDPQVQHAQIFKDLEMTGPSESLQVCSDPYEACESAHAVIILTEWNMFSNKLQDIKQPDSARTDAQALEHMTKSLENLILSSHYAGDDRNLDHCKGHCEGALAKPDHMVYSPVAPRGGAAAEKLDWSRVATLMHRPMHVFDGRNIVDIPKLTLLGFHVTSIGFGFSPVSRRSADTR